MGKEGEVTVAGEGRAEPHCCKVEQKSHPLIAAKNTFLKTSQLFRSHTVPWILM